MGIEDAASIRKARASTYLFRAAAAHVRARVEKSTAERCAKQLFDDVVTPLVLRAGTAQAKTTGSGWADALAATSVDDFVASISVLSAAAGLIAKGMRVDLGHFASIRLPARTFDPAAAGSWIAEGAPIPVRSLNVTASSVYPRKLAVITSWTEELARASNIAEVAGALISEAAAQAFDTALLGTQADNGATPQGILNGVTPISAAGRLGNNLDTASQDIAALAAELAKHGAGLDPVVIAAVAQATMLKMLVAGKAWNLPILPSAALASGVVIMVETGSFASAFSGTPDFSSADVALLHYEDTSPQDITGGSPSPAVPTRSLMQTNGIALRMVLRCAWGMRNRAHVAYLTGANWP